jgi:alkylhydroperoxidase family enzyme
LLADSGGAALPPLERALARFSTCLSDEPWAVTAADVDELRAAGLSEAAVLHTVVQSAFFNYLNRVADAVGIDFDYASTLPRMEKDEMREPAARPPRDAWPRADRAPLVAARFAERPATFEAFQKWRAYLMEREAPLSRRDRRVIAAAVATELCDAATLQDLRGSEPADEREHALAAYAVTLTSAPWRLSERSLEPLRALGLDDRALLDVITVAAYQNTASRIRFLAT